MNVCQRHLLTLGCALLWSSTALSQEFNYATYAVGTRGALMGGAMVGGVRDNSAILYNPGGLGFINNPSLSITANAYQFNQLKQTNGAGVGLDVMSNQIQTLPLLIGGVKRFKLLPRTIVGYGLITRALSAISASARHESLGHVYTLPADSLQEYIGFVQYRSVQRDLAGVMTLGWVLSKRVKSRLAFGISTFGAARIINYGYSLSAEAVSSEELRGPFAYIAHVSANEAFDLTTFRLWWKLGLAYEINGWSLGLTVTSPSVSLGGSAVVSREIIVSNLLKSIPLGQRQPYQDVLASDRQDDLTSNWRTPLSIAAGVERRFGRLTAALSAEWTNSKKSFTVVQQVPRQFLRPSTLSAPVSNEDFLRVTSGAKSVFNWALGLEVELSPAVVLYGSYRSDYSYFQSKPSPSPTNVGRALGLPSTIGVGRVGIDLHHFVLGMTLRREKSDLTAGFTYGTGSKGQSIQLANLISPTDKAYLFSEQVAVPISYQSFGLVVGFTQRLK